MANTTSVISTSSNGSLLAVVAARAGSKGLPGKNIRPMLGVPLLGWPVNAALNSPAVTRTIVSTDCPKIADIAKDCGADAPFLRPAELSCDSASSAEVVIHALDWFEARGEAYDHVVLLEPTSPLTEASDITAAFEMLTTNTAGATSIVGVSELNTHHPVYSIKRSATGFLTPAYSENFGSLPRRQDIESLHFLDGSLYMSKSSVLRQRKTFYTENTLGFVMPDWKSLEVDNLTDFICIEAIMHRKAEIIATIS